MAVSNPRFPHHCTITRPGASDPSKDEGKSIVIYDGICRSYDVQTTSDKGDVVVSNRKLALPQKQDEWTEETIPQEGDEVVVDKFGFKEEGKVIDRMPGNLGTHILWKYGRN